MIRVGDVARVELGAQLYNQKGRLNGKPAAIIAIYQLAGSNAIDTMKQARALMEEAKKRFPDDLDYVVSLDTTLGGHRGHRGDRPDALRGAGPGHHRRVHLPAGLPRDA